MTEKRFMTNEVGCIVDLEHPQLKNYDDQEIVDLLNELHEENTSLKHENQKLRVTLTKIEREFQERGILNEEEIKRLLDD